MQFLYLLFIFVWILNSKKQFLFVEISNRSKRKQLKHLRLNFFSLWFWKLIEFKSKYNQIITFFNTIVDSSLSAIQEIYKSSWNTVCARKKWKFFDVFCFLWISLEIVYFSYIHLWYLKYNDTEITWIPTEIPTEFKCFYLIYVVFFLPERKKLTKLPKHTDARIVIVYLCGRTLRID